MANLLKLPERSPEWSAEAMAMAAQAKVLSGYELEQLVVLLLRYSGRPKPVGASSSSKESKLNKTIEDGPRPSLKSFARDL